MIVALTAGTGFVGQHLVRALYRKHISVRVLVHKKHSKLNVPQFVGDAVTGEGLDAFLRGTHLLINLIGRYYPPTRTQHELNVIAVQSLIDAAASAGIRRMIHVSSTAVYGSAENRAFREDDPLLPNTAYGLTKMLGEDVVRYGSRVYGFSHTIVRPTNIYGPGMTHGAIYDLLEEYKKSHTMDIHGDGKQSRDFINIHDMVSLFTAIIESKINTTVNAASGQVVSLNQLVSKMKRIIDSTITVRHTHAQPDVVRVLSSDAGLAQRLYSWRAKTTLDEGLRELAIAT